MKRLLLALALFVLAAPAMAQNSPCFWSGQLVKCFPTTGIYLDNSRTLRLGTNDTTHYVELKAANGVGTNYTLTYPSAVCASGQGYTQNGSGVQSCVNLSVNPTTTTGDIIYASTTASPATLSRLAIGANGTVLHGGTTPSYSQIVNADVSSSAAIDGTKVTAANTTTAGTITYEDTNIFTANITGPKAISPQTFLYSRNGFQVSIGFSNISTTADATSAEWTTAAGAVPLALRPANDVYTPCFVKDGTDQSVPGYLRVTSNGTLRIGKNWTGTTFTNGNAIIAYGCAINYQVRN